MTVDQKPDHGASREADAICSGPFLIDSHVHMYPRHAVSDFLHGALANFQAEANLRGLSQQGPFLLLFAGTPAEDAFARLRCAAESGECGGWKLASTAERGSLIAVQAAGASLILIDGRQIVTSEGLEVLALGCPDDLPRNLALPKAVELARSRNAIPVIPWGFGKWWLRRGRILRRLLGSQAAQFVKIGDSAARPRLTFRPTILQQASRLNICILPGTDPLPFPGDARRAGSYGLILPGSLDVRRPAEGVKQLIGALEAQPAIYGRRDGLGRFLFRQLRLRMTRGAGARSHAHDR